MANSGPHQDPRALNSEIFLSTFSSSLQGSTVWDVSEPHQKLQDNYINQTSKRIDCGELNGQ